MMYFDVLTVQYSVQLIADVLTVQYLIQLIPPLTVNICFDVLLLFVTAFISHLQAGHVQRNRFIMCPSCVHMKLKYSVLN
jgi:uncharacterized phage infection (PIP) family protein YhgE